MDLTQLFKYYITGNFSRIRATYYRYSGAIMRLRWADHVTLIGETKMCTEQRYGQIMEKGRSTDSGGDVKITVR
jgi:hypothetical protein